MNREEIIEIVNNAMVEEFELEEAHLTPETRLIDDLALDSLDFVDMVVLLQNAFNIKLRDDKAAREVRTLGDIYQLIMARLPT